MQSTKKRTENEKRTFHHGRRGFERQITQIWPVATVVIVCTVFRLITAPVPGKRTQMVLQIETPLEKIASEIIITLLAQLFIKGDYVMLSVAYSTASVVSVLRP